MQILSLVKAVGLGPAQGHHSEWTTLKLIKNSVAAATVVDET